jgi:hypothetical protein
VLSITASPAGCRNTVLKQANHDSGLPGLSGRQSDDISISGEKGQSPQVQKYRIDVGGWNMKDHSAWHEQAILGLDRFELPLQAKHRGLSHPKCERLQFRESSSSRMLIREKLKAEQKSTSSGPNGAQVRRGTDRQSVNSISPATGNTCSTFIEGLQDPLECRYSHEAQPWEPRPITEKYLPRLPQDESSTPWRTPRSSVRIE